MGTLVRKGVKKVAKQHKYKRDTEGHKLKQDIKKKRYADPGNKFRRESKTIKRARNTRWD